MAMATRGSIERLIFTSFLLSSWRAWTKRFRFFRHRAMPVISCGFRSQVVRDDALSG
jgi:hypothetical protein